MELKTLYFLSIFLFAASGCVNPTIAIQAEIKTFKTEHKDQIHQFKGKHRTMQYAASGDPTKRPILFVHGSPGSWEGWSHFLLDPKLQKNFHLIAVDRPGYGGSLPGVSVTSLSIQVADVLEVLEINKSQQSAILVGHSFGGPVIAKAAMDFPNRVAGLVFVASSVSADLETTKWFQYPANWWPFRYLVPTSLRVCNEEILPLKSELNLMMPDWKNIKARSVLIQGELDDLVPPGNLDFLIQNLNEKTVLKVVRVKDMNHFIPWNRPELIMEALWDIEHAL